MGKKFLGMSEDCFTIDMVIEALLADAGTRPGTKRALLAFAEEPDDSAAALVRSLDASEWTSFCPLFPAWVSENSEVADAISGVVAQMVGDAAPAPAPAPAAPVVTGGASTSDAPAPAPVPAPTASSLVRALVTRFATVKASDGSLQFARLVVEILYAGTWNPVVRISSAQLESIVRAAGERINLLYDRETRVSGVVNARISALVRDSGTDAERALYYTAWGGTGRERCYITHAVQMFAARATSDLWNVDMLPCGGCDGCCGVLLERSWRLFPVPSTLSSTAAQDVLMDPILRRTVARLWPELAPAA